MPGVVAGAGVADGRVEDRLGGRFAGQVGGVGGGVGGAGVGYCRWVPAEAIRRLWGSPYCLGEWPPRGFITWLSAS